MTSVIASALCLSSVVPISAASPKSGSTCSKAGATQTYKNLKFTCIKYGKKLIWSKGVVVKRPQPSPTPSASSSISPTPIASPTSTPSTTASPTASQSQDSSSGSSQRFKQKRSVVSYAPPSMQSENLDLCKIQQPGNGGVKSGFPAATPLYQGKGVVTWALIPLDFADLQGEANFIPRAKAQMQSASEWAESTSEGQLKIEWKIHEYWIRLPGLSTDYAIPASDNNGFGSPKQQDVWLRAITESDKYFDFTGIQAVQFILPVGQSIIKYGIKGNSGFDVVKNYKTGEGTRIELFSIPSTFNEEPGSGRNYWSWWMYHYMVGLGVAKFGGSRISPPFHSYLIMGSTEGARELGGWLRFLIGWMPENRVYCRSVANLSTLDITLIPLPNNSAQGIKLAVFPLSEKKALILESWRETKFSCTTYTERNGVLAYIYDSSYGQEGEYFKPIAPSERSIESYSCFASPNMDYLLHEGDKVNYEGVSIELIGHGDFDKVRVSRNS